jgi:hypothetical protein
MQQLRDRKVGGAFSMKCFIRFFLIFSFMALIACCSCGPTIESEVRGAQQAMEKAQSFRADELAPSDWEDAMLTWKQAQAAVAERRSAKTLLRKAKSQFNKAAETAEANGKAMAKEVGDLQVKINKRYQGIKAALAAGKPNSKIEKELEPLLMEVALNSSSIENMNMHWDYVKAKSLAQNTLRTVETAEQMMAGNKNSR